VGGGMVQSKLFAGGTSVDLGFQRISRSDPMEKWKLYEPNGRKLWVSGTHTINVQADDLTTQISTNRFLAPETPPAGATVFTELARVARPYMNVIIDGSLTDRAVPAAVVYKDDRIATLQQLCDAIGAGMRATGSGHLAIFPLAATSAVWIVAGASHDGALIDSSRSAVYAGLYNGVVSTNTLPDGTALVGTAFQKTGDLAWDGPHGHVPYFHNANFATTQSAINADAQTQLDTLIRQRASTIPFTATLHPGIETGDTVGVMMPIHDGSEHELDGVVSGVTIGGTGNVNAAMTFTLNVPDSSVEAIAALNRTRWLA
jgi:hypothetical protein